MTVNFLHICWIPFHKFSDPKYFSKRCSESLILLGIIFGCQWNCYPFFAPLLFERFEGLNITFYALQCPVSPVLPIIFNLLSNKES